MYLKRVCEESGDSSPSTPSRLPLRTRRVDGVETNHPPQPGVHKIKRDRSISSEGPIRTLNRLDSLRPYTFGKGWERTRSSLAPRSQRRPKGQRTYPLVRVIRSTSRRREGETFYNPLAFSPLQPLPNLGSPERAQLPLTSRHPVPHTRTGETLTPLYLS